MIACLICRLDGCVCYFFVKTMFVCVGCMLVSSMVCLFVCLSSSLIICLALCLLDCLFDCLLVCCVVCSCVVLLDYLFVVFV